MKEKIPENWQARWIAPAEEMDCHPILFKKFFCENIPEQAKLFVTGLGLFEVYLNGEKLGEDVLAPFFDEYNDRTQVLLFDIDNLAEGANTLEIWLGNGWYKGRFGMIPRTDRYGTELCAIAQLEMIDTAGEQICIGTDESWLCRESPVLNSGIYDGERQDHTRCGNAARPVKISSRATDMLIPRDSLPLRIVERLPVKQVIHTPSGETVLDFGQNFAGWVEVECAQSFGTNILLEFGEVLVDGCFYNENYRTAKGGFSFVCNGTQRVYHPHFTYFGFRYVKVSGWDGEVTGKEFSGCVIHSDLHRTGWFSCGHEGVNRLYENIRWSQKSNFVDIPTDCPQRDERMPWGGDTQMFSSTADLNMNCKDFFLHYLDLIRPDQIRHNGGVSNYIPYDPVLNDPCAIWGDAVIQIPMMLYEHYGEKEILERCFPMMVDWSEYLARQDAAAGGRWLNDHGFQFGDWLALDGVTESSFKGATEDGLVATFYWYHSMNLMVRAAEILGKETERVRYGKMAEAIRNAAFEEYFTPNGRLAVDTQTAYLLSLRFGLYPDRERIAAGLLQRLQKDCWQLTSGFAAAPLICSVLADNGMEKEAMRLLLNENYPGWLYEVKQGATTIWERWNSLLPDGRVNPAGMNSFNHFSYGSVGQFLYERIAGLKGTAPGFRSVCFAPCVDARLGHCEAAYESAAGRWESKWRILETGEIYVSLLVPDGCTAEVKLPFSGRDAVTVESGLFENTYVPVVDITAKYTTDSLLEDLFDDREALEILGRKAPALAGIAASHDKELGAVPLAQLAFVPHLGLTPELMGKLIDELGKLKYICGLRSSESAIHDHGKR